MRLALALLLVAAPALAYGPEKPTAWYDAPMHGEPGGVQFGLRGELRFHYDRVFGVADPNWLTFVQAGAFASAPLSKKVTVLGAGGYDRNTKEIEVLRLGVDWKWARSTHAQGGVFLLPLLQSNLDAIGPHEEFTDRTFVATELVGVPIGQLGVGVRHRSYEVDLVTGYDGGLLTDAPDGTRLPAGRNTFAGYGGSGAAVARASFEGANGRRLGVAVLGGVYTPKDPEGVAYGGSRPVALATIDGARPLGGFLLRWEGGFAHADVPQGLEELFAQDQWAGAVTVTKTLKAPLWKSWENSALSGGIRLDGVDYDLGLAGDSRRRLSTTLDLRQQPFGILRWGWYYEVRYDRLGNPTPSAGVTLSAGTFL